MNIYVFKPYNKKYVSLFIKEKKKLTKLLGDKSVIEHIGSTSVPGLGGKGIIDIIASVEKDKMKIVKDKLVKNKYSFYSEHGNEERYYFVKVYRGSEVHVHITIHNGIEWKKGIAVRNYLIENEKLKEEYSKIKKEAVKIAKGEGKIYRKHKHDFLQKITKEAVKKYYNEQL